MVSLQTDVTAIENKILVVSTGGLEWITSVPISRIVEASEVDILTIYVGVSHSPEVLSTSFLDVGGSCHEYFVE